LANETKGKLTGKCALVTGASSGIGAAVAARFVSEGAAVSLVARGKEGLEATAKSIGGKTCTIPADVADPDQVAEAVGQTIRTLDGLDIVVNSAGITVLSRLCELTPSQWRAVIDANLSGTFYVSREAAIHMLAHNGGSIVNLGSELSFMGMSLLAPYCASKAGVLGLTKAMAVELAPTVTVNAVCPGPVATPMMEAEIAWFDDPGLARQESIDRVPMRRWATPDEVAAAVLFLVTDAPFATGSAISLDGGTTAI